MGYGSVLVVYPCNFKEFDDFVDKSGLEGVKAGQKKLRHASLDHQVAHHLKCGFVVDQVMNNGFGHFFKGFARVGLAGFFEGLLKHGSYGGKVLDEGLHEKFILAWKISVYCGWGDSGFRRDVPHADFVERLLFEKL